MNPKILIVDDDKDDIDLLLEIFHSTDYRNHIKTFDAADTVLSYLGGVERSFYPRLIISDVNMPKCSGIWLLEKVKTNSSYQSIPFVLCSTTIVESDKKRGLELGVTDFVVKPLTLQQLEDFKHFLLEILSKEA